MVQLLGWLWWLRAVSRLTCLVASHAVLTWRAGEGGGLILPALAKSAPTLPSPPRHPGTARCAACGCACRNASSFCASAASFSSLWPAFFRVSPHSGAGAHGIARTRGEPSDNLCSQRAEDGSPLVRAQSEVAPPQTGQREATPPQPCSGRPTQTGFIESPGRSVQPLRCTPLIPSTTTTTLERGHAHISP